MAYACRILADSISPAGHRITSFEVTFPRIVLAEVNTHCMLARNSASSRAIPVPKRIAAVEADPFVPEAFGRNQKGMQPGDPLEAKESEEAERIWRWHRTQAVGAAAQLAELGVHKQYANRLLEPFSWHTAVITATDVDNFFHLRVNPLAQGEFQKAARMMLETRDASEPHSLNYGEWHTPYVDHGERFDLEVKGVDVGAISVTRCARLSYLTQNDKRDLPDELARYSSLITDGHMSPLEHVARPMSERELRITKAFDVAVDDGPILRASWDREEGPAVGALVRIGGEVGTATFVRGPLHYSAKLNGWISRRAFVHGEHDILGHRASVEG